jgi:rsbT co-antagonist protein RsbR
MDITGVRVVDTQVANALLRAAQAARLLGAEVVLTGINAEVAQTIVQLGVNMDQIVTRCNLQAGIAYALK